MKSIVLIIFVLIFNSTFSQTNDARSTYGTIVEVIKDPGEGNSGIYMNKPKDIVGNIHVFENWETDCKIVIGEKVYKLRKLNLNILSDQFEAEVGNDSIFAFNATNFDYIYINNRKFKSFYEPKIGKDKNFELIYDGEDVKLLKGYEVNIKYNDPDPLMVKKNVDNYFITDTYYTKKGEDIDVLRPTKKNILNIFGDKAELINKYVKNNKLSYKDDKDLNKMFIYYDSL